jgi:8-oxo-dGTP pyrophosphatase MutT (NUDIX family)
MVGYSLGHLKEITPRNVAGVSKVWALQVSSPMLSAIRKSYGLQPFVNGHPFHITVAVRRKNVLQANSTRKAAAAAKSPQPRVRVVVPYKDQYLMETLNNSKWPENIGKRRFIGGGIETGETPEQAAARELFEELGVKIKPTAFRALGNDPREGWQHEHYLELPKHKLKPGNFNATVGSDAVVTLSHGLPEGDDYMGPDIKKLLAPVLKKANDLLHGGAADNMSDSKFPKEELAEGAEHEREHTDNDQIAKEIAKDHLQEDPAYYKKVEAIEKDAATAVVPVPQPPKPPEMREDVTAPPEMPPPPTADVAFGVVPPPALPPSGQQLQSPQQTPEQEEQDKQAESKALLLAELQAAKEHSDNKRYELKTQILRRLMQQSPQDWRVDDPKPYHKGITHGPTKFKFHVEPTAIPASVKAAARQPRSAYMSALYNSYGLHRPITYNYNKTVAENIQDQMMMVKQRGDFMRNAKINHQRYMATLDPKYRYELAMKAMNNELEEEPMVDKMIGRYGDSFMNTIFGRPK